MPFVAFNLFLQNWYLLGVIMNSKPCPQNEILVPFRGVFENFPTSTPIIFIGKLSSPPGETLQFAIFFPAIFKYVLENTKRSHNPSL